MLKRTTIALLSLCLLGSVAAAHTGKVLETMDSGGYTYVKLEAAKGPIWLAGPQTTLKVGDEISCDDGNLMQNFASKSLDRSFPEIWFVNNISGGSAGSMVADPHAGIPGFRDLAPKGPEKPEVGSVSKAGQSVEEIYASSKKLSGSAVEIRGVVVKYSSGIMGKNWLHIQDGSGSDGTDDLTITTQQNCKVGDTVLVKGKLSTDVDVGAGYFYSVLIQDADVTVEGK